MRDWYGVIVLLATIAVALFLAWGLLRRSSHKSGSSGNHEYDKLVMRTILPSNHGISIDNVYNALKDADLSEFHLDTCTNRDDSNAERNL